MTRRYAILDVFTDKVLSGNPLAVVLDSEGLDYSQMQSIAAEFNLSETVFVQEAENPAQPTPIRIFTPANELPFAGHPTVGTAMLLALDRLGPIEQEQDAMVVLAQQVGNVRCGIVLKSNSNGYAEFDIPTLPKKREFKENKDAIASALNIEAHEIGFENHRATSYEAGVPFNFVPVHNIGVLEQVIPNLENWNRTFRNGSHDSTFVYCRETRLSDSNFHARMFAPAMGIPEDPATGSAAAAFAGVIAEYDAPRIGNHHYRIEQGFKMGRPSIIKLEIEMKSNNIHSARIGGNAVIVARGELLV